MTDNGTDNDGFETRARAAAHAIHEAIERPTSTSAGTAHRSRGPIRALAIAAVVTVIAVVGTTVIVNNRADRPSSDVTDFCTQIETSASQPVNTVTDESTGKTTTDRTDHADDYLLGAPPEIHDVAVRIHVANAHNRSPDSTDTTKLLNWFEIHCYPDAAQPDAGPDQQRFAPLPEPADVTICSATNRLLTSRNSPYTDGSGYGEITIFGDSALADPYVAPMIGLASSRTERFRDDGTETPVTIPNHPDAAISTMSSAFSNRIEGSQVITWVDGNRTIAVFGRSYGAERTDQLIAVASKVRMDGTRPTVPLDALPVDFQELYQGPLIDVSTEIIASNPSGNYSLIGNEGNLQIGASTMWEGGEGRYEAIRFFAPGITLTTVAGKAVLMGPTLRSDSRGLRTPQLARWSPSPGVVLTALSLPGTGAPSPVDLRAVVAATRKLNRSEWEALINQSGGCFGDLVSSRTATGAGSAPSSATSSPGSSPTTAVTGGP